MSDDPLIGFSDDSLVFEQQLGKGAMGAVYRGTQVRLNRPVAIKVIAKHLADDPAYVERFNREAQTMGRLSHPNVIACHDFGSTQGPEGELLVMVLEFVDGWSLGALAKEKKLTVRQVVELHRQAAEGLAAANALGIVHRDIKPDNLMVTRQGQVKLADFGLAKADDSVMVTQTGAIVGSPAFMSPEAARGENPTHLGDCYSLACSLFALLAGTPPYMSNSALNVLHQHASAAIPSLAERGRGDLAPLFDPFFAKAMAKDPSDRFADSHAMALALRELANQVPPQLFAGAGRGSEELGGISADAATMTKGSMATIATRQPSDPKPRPAGRRRSSPSNPRARARSGEHPRHRDRSGKQMHAIIALAAIGILLVVGLVAVTAGGGQRPAPPPSEPTPEPEPAPTLPTAQLATVDPAPPEPEPAPTSAAPEPEADDQAERLARLAAAREGIESELGVVSQLMMSGQLGRAETALGLVSVPEHIDYQDLRDNKVMLGDQILRLQHEAVVTTDHQLDAVEAALAAGDVERARALLDGLQLPAHPRFERLARPLATGPAPAASAPDGAQPSFPLIPDAPAPAGAGPDGPVVLQPHQIQGQLVYPLEDQVPGGLPHALPQPQLWRSVLDRDGRSHLLALELPADTAGATLHLVVHGGLDRRELRLVAMPGERQFATATLEADAWQVAGFDLAELPAGARGVLVLASGPGPIHLAQAGLAPAGTKAITVIGGTLMPLRTSGGTGSVEALLRRMVDATGGAWLPNEPTLVVPAPGGRDETQTAVAALEAMVTRCYRSIPGGGFPVRPRVVACRSNAEALREIEAARDDGVGLLLVAFQTAGLPSSSIRNWSTFVDRSIAMGVLPVLVLLPDGGDDLALNRGWQRAIDDIRERDPELPIIRVHTALAFADGLDLAWREDEALRQQLVVAGIEAGLHEFLWRLSVFREGPAHPPPRDGIGFPD